MFAIQPQQQHEQEQYEQERPEHLYYNFIENYFIKCIQSGNEFLYNSTLFDNELERLHEKFHIPYSVSLCFVCMYESIDTNSTYYLIYVNND